MARTALVPSIDPAQPAGMVVQFFVGMQRPGGIARLTDNCDSIHDARILQKQLARAHRGAVVMRSATFYTVEKARP